MTIQSGPDEPNDSGDSSGAQRRRALVIGGAGRMGGWLIRFLTGRGYAVEAADPRRPATDVPHLEDWHTSALDHHLIVVAAPLRTTAGILAELAARRPPGVVLDVGSIKTPLRPGLDALRKAGVRAASIHPMFGPDTELRHGGHVILVDLGVPEANRMVEELFDDTGAELVSMDLECHDRAVAYVLGLSHAVNIAFFTALADAGQPAADLLRLSSTTFDHQVIVASRVAHENPSLYYEIQRLNPWSADALRALAQAGQRIQSLVEAGDEPGFCQLMERGSRFFASEDPTTRSPREVALRRSAIAPTSLPRS